MCTDIPGYDDWKFDIPEPIVVCTCEECGRDIYKGEVYLEVDGTILCDFMDCFTDHALKVLQYTEKEA